MEQRSWTSLLTFGFFGGAAQPPSAGPLVVKERHDKVTGLTEIYSPNVDVEVKLEFVPRFFQEFF